MIADILNNKKFNPAVTELFIRVKKLHISLTFITQSYFAVQKNIRPALKMLKPITQKLNN